jgi:Uma2 family endonuclease
MAKSRKTPAEIDNLGELVRRLSGVPLKRIRMQPPPGTATERDVLAAAKSPRKRLCELVDGVLVEKAMGTEEALLAGVIVSLMGVFVRQHKLGGVLPGAGMVRLEPGLVRIPDVSFISRKQIRQNREARKKAIATFVPELAVEVLSRSNTKKEIARKLRDYFLNGTLLVWVIDRKRQQAHVYTSPTDVQVLGVDDVLDGEDVLPGFRLPLRELFEEGSWESIAS